MFQAVLYKLILKPYALNGIGVQKYEVKFYNWKIHDVPLKNVQGLITVNLFLCV